MKPFGLLGRKLSHSISPEIHAELCDYEYLLFEKEPQELDGFFEEKNFSGLNVTIPYKKDVIKYCSALSPAAEKIGSVNTITIKKTVAAICTTARFSAIIRITSAFLI